MSRGTLDQNLVVITFTYVAITLYGATFQLSSISHNFPLCSVRNPAEPGSAVWPISISLAATLEIEFSFFSCRYLDVSVHGVFPR